MNFIKISILLTINNNSIFTRRCLDSFVAQLENHTELLIVSTGPKLGIQEMLCSYANSVENISVVFFPENAAAEAIFAGIEKARGEYICFFDCSDCIEKNGVLTMLDSLKYDADLFIYGASFKKQTSKLWCYSTSDFSDEYVRNSYPMPLHRCKMLYRKDILVRNHMRFDEGCSFEEKMLSIALYLKCCLYVLVSSDEIHLSGASNSLLPKDDIPDLFHMLTELNRKTTDTILHLCKNVSAEEKRRFIQNAFADCIVSTVSRFAEHPEEMRENLPILNKLAFGPSGIAMWAGEKPVCTADVLIVLGCPYCDTRIEAALDYGGHDTKMTYLVTGGNLCHDEVHTEAEYMAHHLLKRGIRLDNIVLENSAVNTVENLQKSFSLICELVKRGKLKVKEIGIVTEAFHENYVLQCAGKLGLPEQLSVKLYVCFGQYATPDKWYQNETAMRNILYNISRTYAATYTDTECRTGSTDEVTEAPRYPIQMM